MKELVKEEGGQVRLSKVGGLNLSQMLPTYKKIKSVEWKTKKWEPKILRRALIKHPLIINGVIFKLDLFTN